MLVVGTRRILFFAMGCGAGSGLTAINNLGQVSATWLAALSPAPPSSLRTWLLLPS